MAASKPIDTRAEWVRGLQRFLYYQILVPIIPNDNERVKYVSQAVFDIWERAFIHSSVNVTENYESLETLGDVFIKKAFFVYLQNRFQDVSNVDFTNFATRFLSKPYMKKISEATGLAKWLRVDNEIDITYSDLEDVFESFVGALYFVAEKIKQKELKLPEDSTIVTGEGDNRIYKLVEYLFKNTDLNREYLLGDPRSIVKEIFEMPKWEEVLGANPSYHHVKAIPVLEDGEATKKKRYRIQVILPPKAIDYLVAEKGLKYIPGQMIIIGSAEAVSKDLAQAQAYAQAQDTLESYGITHAFARQMAREAAQRKLESREDLFSRALVKAQSQGYISIEFKEPKASRSNRGSLVQLIGIRTEMTPTGPVERKDIIEKFFSKKIGQPEYPELFEKYLGNGEKK